MLFSKNKSAGWAGIIAVLLILTMFVIILYSFLRPDKGLLNKGKDASSELIDNHIDSISDDLNNLGDDNGINTASPEDLAIWFTEFKNRLNLYKEDESCYILVPVFSGLSRFGVDKSNLDFSTITFSKSLKSDSSTLITSSQSYGSIDYDRFLLPREVTVYTKDNGGLSLFERLVGDENFPFNPIECSDCNSFYFKSLTYLAFGDKQYDAERRNEKISIYTIEIDDIQYYVLFKPHMDYYVFLENANRYFNGIIREMVDGNTHIKKC